MPIRILVDLSQSRACRSDLAPVQTILPELKSKEVVFGFLRWYTAWKLFRPIFYAGEYAYDRVQINILMEGRRRDHVLDVDESPCAPSFSQE
jgi:hypothetical protein